MRKHNWTRALKFLPLVLLLIALFGFVVMTLWNWLMPALFGWKAIGYAQAFGLILLTRILFGGFRGPGRPSSRWRRRLIQRWESMTPEEREKFRQALDRRCGRVPPPDPTPAA